MFLMFKGNNTEQRIIYWKILPPNKSLLPPSNAIRTADHSQLKKIAVCRGCGLEEAYRQLSLRCYPTSG